MGVLMSKKQQVERVQKCNAVVSAFQAGIKDRPATAKPAEREAEDGDGPAKAAVHPDDKDAEEPHREEADSGAGPSTSQQTSASTRDECKVNQEAWSRLRDGKGVEPEDLDKSHQLTPPAFVRPKREANDDQPIEVDLEEKEQVLHNAINRAVGLTVVLLHLTKHARNTKVQGLKWCLQDVKESPWQRQSIISSSSKLGIKIKLPAVKVLWSFI